MNSCIGNGKSKKTTKKGTVAAAKLSTDPQSVAARQRRHRISDRFKILQSLVPGGSKMDTVSMLEEAIQYVKFLKAQIWLHQAMISSFVEINNNNNSNADTPTSTIFPPSNYDCSPVFNPFYNQQHVCNLFSNYEYSCDNEVQTSQVGFQDEENVPFEF